MEHIVPEQLFARQLVEKTVWPVAFGDMRKLVPGLPELPIDPNSDQYMIPSEYLPDTSALPATKLCRPCEAITLEALESETGYVHSKDVRNVLQTAKSCHLCEMIRSRICDAVKFHVQHPTKITDALEALRLFADFMEKNNYFMIHPAPLILRLDSTRAPSIGKLVALGTLMATPSENNSRNFRLANVQYWGRFQLHGEGEHRQLPLIPRESDQQTLTRLQVWLREREKEIPSWSNAGRANPLPTRLLDLGPPGEGEMLKTSNDICLRETTGLYGKYVALSYCWGGYVGCRTLKQNYKARCRNIDFEALPTVFAEAVKVTRALGIQYLWIDALCIIQDDLDDWNKEAAKMSTIYSNTVCRIAVTDSANPTQSFFPPKVTVCSVQLPNCLLTDHGKSKDAGKMERMPLSEDFMRDGLLKTLANKNGPRVCIRGQDELSSPSASKEVDDVLEMCMSDMRQHARCLLRERETTSRSSLPSRSPETDQQQSFSVKGQTVKGQRGAYLTIPRAYTLEVDRGVLNSRAWVLQERLLAPRTIHFTSDHIYCEDQDDICGEDWIRRYFTWLSCIDKSSVLARVNLFPEDGFSSGNYTTQNMSSNSVYPWLRICEKYSRCRLSVEADRLAAMAGLVNKKAGNPAERNLFGLWQRNLHNELMWYGRDCMKRLDELKLPSWAWIAYEGRIGFVKDGRTKRDPQAVQKPPAAEFVLTTCDVPDMMTKLPLKRLASLTIRVRLRKLDAFSHHPVESRSKDTSREQLAAASPFHFDPRTGTIPLAISAYVECREIYDQDRTTIGFACFDDKAPGATGQLFCAHISTLYDEAVHEATRQLDNPGIKRVDLDAYREPILAYALLVTKVNDEQVESDFQRVGVAEINYEWMKKAGKATIRVL